LLTTLSVAMAIDLSSVSYLALYIVSVHVLDTNSRTSTHWRLNADTGKVEVAALAADSDANSAIVAFPNDPMLNMLTNRVSLANGEWKLEAEPPSCYDSCSNHEKPTTQPTENKNVTRSVVNLVSDMKRKSEIYIFDNEFSKLDILFQIACQLMDYPTLQTYTL